MKYKQSYGDKQRDEQKRTKAAVPQNPPKEQAAEPADRKDPPKPGNKKAV